MSRWPRSFTSEAISTIEPLMPELDTMDEGIGRVWRRPSS